MNHMEVVPGTVSNVIASNMSDTRVGKKEKYQHIQVFIRVRPLNKIEIKRKSKNVIETPPNGKEVIVHERQPDKVSKKFKFDSVFGPSSKQIDVYNAVVSPLLQQVLDGYNCTVFAYGQTGTGKTFTMEGINKNPTLHWQTDSSAGMIPRSLSHLFDKLELIESQEYTVRVSFLELYNEELFDLLSTNDDASKIRLYEDASKKGAIIIHGLEEVTIHNKSEVSKLLEKGSERRQTAATLLNAHSSRSHTLFSITVHMKEHTIEGEEVLRTGKLNLVDLAGSENVGRSGAIDKRAREAGSVNQSLLALGRVITALLERAPHIPYRESKLTRLLQESLGGRTKTSIIATVSPGSINLEETLSTLDYAHRAKHVTNRPEINQKLTKTEFLNQYTEEIERLRKDLLTAREKSGVYLADENYNEMQATISQQTKEIEEKINHIKALEETMQEREKILAELELENIAQREELREAKAKLDTTTDALKSINYRLRVTSQERDEQKYLVEKHVSTEKVLLAHGRTLLNVADTAITDSLKLHEKIDRKTKSEETFKVIEEQFKRNFRECKQGIEKEISSHGEALKQFCGSMKNDIGALASQRECASIGTGMPQMPNNLDDKYSIMANNLTKSIRECYQRYQNSIKRETESIYGTMKQKDEMLNTMHMKLAQDIDNLIKIGVAKNMNTVRNNLHEKLKHASTRMTEMVESARKRELEACDRMKTDINKIKVAAEELREKQDFTQKERLFAKKLDEVSAQFKRLTESERKHYVATTNECDNINEISKKVNDRSTHASGVIRKMRNNLKEQTDNDLKKVEATVTVGTEKNEELSNRTEREGKILLDELDSRVNTSYSASKQYQDLIKCNLKEMQQSMEVDKNEQLSVINDMRGAIANVSEEQVTVVKDQATKTSDTFQKMSSEFESRIAESNAWSNKVVEKLDATASEIDKFLDEDVQRDVPTGTTPARKEFSYPREFTVTSPHERILQRFREVRQLVETAEVEVDES
ncbi:kinesin-like protein Klp61F [Andrena cerasifolii]|uniref:kinesin-like protein Klp61F n=1 Tax=Andrena cerasifolii TaxID=2819439 RepID=UPI0040381805